MKFLVLFIAFVFASENNVESNEMLGQNANAPILVKIEEEFVKLKKTKTPKYIGVLYNETNSKWRAYRRSKNDKKNVYNGTYKDEETAAHASDTLARKLMENCEKGHRLNFPDDDTEVHPEEDNKYIGVIYSENQSRWRAQRWSKNENKPIYNGLHKDEETAAHASDTLARKLIANGEHHKLNFPDDDTEVNKRIKTSKYIGVAYSATKARWKAQRWSKNEKTFLNNGSYKDEETAAHASDSLARKLMVNGEHHKLNIPDDDTEVYAEEKSPTSKYIGVCYNKKDNRWHASRWSKNEKRMISNGAYKYEEKAAHASDTLARILAENGDQKLKLNFPDDDSELRKNKRKRPNDFDVSQTDGNFEKFEGKKREKIFKKQLAD